MAQVPSNAVEPVAGIDTRLVWELVANLQPRTVILKRYGLTEQDLIDKLRDPTFRAAYREVRAKWKSDLNVQERIRIKAGLLLEDSLVDIIQIIKDPGMPALTKLDATKQLGDLSQTRNAKANGAGGDAATFKLTIIGAPAGPVTIDGQVINRAEDVA